MHGARSFQLVIVCVAMACLMNASSGYAADRGVRIVINGTEQCLDADLAQIGSDGTNVQLYHCSGGDNQIWLYPARASGENGMYSGPLRNLQSGRCLDVFLPRFPAQGSNVQLWTCWQAPAGNQNWSTAVFSNETRVLVASPPTGFATNSNVCLDAFAGTGITTFPADRTGRAGLGRTKRETTNNPAQSGRRLSA
jgi:Ricin-type beta-trefoil lectin domain